MAHCTNPDARLVELQAKIAKANVDFGEASSAYSDAHFEARWQAEARGEPVQRWTGNPKQDHIDALPFDTAWGILDKRQAYEQAEAHCDALMQEVFDTPATGIDGIWAKLEIWHMMDVPMKAANDMPLDEFSMYEERMAVAALRDARRLVTA